MTKKSVKKYFTSIILIVLSVMVAFLAVSCNNADTDTNTDFENNNTENNGDSQQAGIVGDVGDFEAPDESQTKKRVALTFDDGPHNVRTKAIVDELDKYGFHATFFVVGNRVDGKEYSGGKTVSYVLEHGNEVGIHGYTHKYYYHNCDDATYEYELNATLEAIHKYEKDYNVTLMRPIGGNITDERVADCDYSVIMWNVDSEDWKNKYSSDDTEAGAAVKVNIIVENVMSQVNDGSIILMHDIYESTVDAVKKILKRLDEEGYEVVTVSELLGDAKAGVKYNKG